MKNIKFIFPLLFISVIYFSCKKEPCEKDTCIDKSKICLTCPIPVYAFPVCGCDGKTYDNPDAAELIGGVRSWTKGPCNAIDTTCIDSSKICLSCPITMEVDPVCGCDGKTYGNPMAAEVHGGVKFWTKGPCNGSIDTTCIDSSKICNTCFCPSVYDPVCGCDGITYGNSCEAENAGVKSWTQGPCNTPIDTTCIDSSKICITCVCPSVYDPVCGCDEITYSNSCEAGNAGVKSWIQGPCHK